ncbi:thioredoxin family protein [Roseibacterium beibuensis]|uniref:Thioredoxin-like fold domain-containing protein n=1 Tax=[Roseibacterium] beibuensis TaxID=1193142 RepID=A0ABP9KVN8_9RHOB|nr:thioredoxin family protein [Roseibacterium beibuensis]MCS6621965.1 thioredoxin family protein [Roseibacterium beibuensis]
MLRTVIAAAMIAVAPLATAAQTLNGDGLHEAEWLHETFRDLREDLGDANAEGKRFAVIIEQRGCIYCTRMHEEVFVVPEIEEMLSEEFFFVRLNMHGATEVTDFDGEVMSESDIARRWRNMFTPTILFFDSEVPDGLSGAEAAVVTMPGAFGAPTMYDLLNWILAEGYDGEEDFQRYHARMFNERAASGQRIGADD